MKNMYNKMRNFLSKRRILHHNTHFGVDFIRNHFHVILNDANSLSIEKTNDGYEASLLMDGYLTDRRYMLTERQYIQLRTLMLSRLKLEFISVFRLASYVEILLPSEKVHIVNKHRHYIQYSIGHVSLLITKAGARCEIECDQYSISVPYTMEEMVWLFSKIDVLQVLYI